MRASFCLFFLTCFLFTNSFLSAQKKYKTGQFYLSDTLWADETGDINDLNDLRNGFLKFQVEDQYKYFAYNDSIFAKVFLDSTDAIKNRTVYNFNRMKTTHFETIAGKTYYKIYDILPINLSKNIFNGNPVEYKNRGRIIHDKRRLDTLNEWELVTYPINFFIGLTKELSITNQLEFPYLKYVRPKAENEIDSNVIFKSKTPSFANGIWSIREIKKFTPFVVNTEWLNDSVEGLKHRSSYVNLARKKSDNTVYPLIEGAPIMINKAIALMNLGRFSSYHYTMFKNNRIFGNMYILKEAVRSTTLYHEKEPYYNQLDTLQELGLISGQDTRLFKTTFRKNTNWSPSTMKSFMELYLIHKYLNNNSARELLLNNYRKNGYKFNLNNSEENDFIRGRMNLSELLGKEQNIITTTFPRIIRSDTDSIFKEARRFLTPILERLTSTYSIYQSRDAKKLIVENDGLTYSLDLYNIVKNHTNSDKKIKIDKNILKEWLILLQQINADTGHKKAIILKSWNEMFRTRRDDERLEEFTKYFKDLELVNNKVYVLCANKKFDFYRNISIGVEIPFEKENHGINEYDFSDVLYQNDIDTYVSSYKKNAFLQHLSEYTEEYKISEEELAEIRKKVNSGLYVLEYELINLIPRFSKHLPNYLYGFPQIDSTKNNFSDVFPELDKLMNGEFKAINLRIDPLSKYILEMEHNGEQIGVHKSSYLPIKELIKTLNTHLEKKGKALEYVEYEYGRNRYIYIDKEILKKLKDIFRDSNY